MSKTAFCNECFQVLPKTMMRYVRTSSSLGLKLGPDGWQCKLNCTVDAKGNRAWIETEDGVICPHGCEFRFQTHESDCVIHQINSGK